MIDPRSRWRRFAREAGLVLAALALVSILIHFLDLDRRVSTLFYRPGASTPWWGKGQVVWDAVYRYASWPGFAVAGAALVMLAVSLVRPALRRHRRACGVVALSLALGPGLLVNAALKGETGRPRPRNVTEFGGTERYRPVGSIDWGGKGASFPSGHVSMGFYLVTLYVVWRRSRPRAAAAALAAAGAAGAVIGFQRVAVGAHFVSDVLWAGGVDYVAALFLSTWLMSPGPVGSSPPGSQPSGARAPQTPAASHPPESR